MKRMKILVVDDEVIEINLLVEALRSTDLFEVTVEKSYYGFGKDEGSILRHISEYDLLVLDALIGSSTNEFQSVASAIGGSKPFIAYTRYTPDYAIGSLDTFEEIRQTVFLNGGLGIVTKSFNQYQSSQEKKPSERDTAYLMLERILNFYWTGFRN